ncbi:MAG TPA: hypothetical protein VF252_04045 [Gemmatimonadales bacterium]
MGSNLLIVFAALTFQNPQQDSAATGTHGFDFERLSDLFQYNRVQGLSFGMGYRVSLPGLTPVQLYGTARYGVSDERVTGRLTIMRGDPARRIALSGYSDVADLDPLSPGRTVSNTVNSLLAGHDNGDYAYARGGSLSFETSLESGVDLKVMAAIERQTDAAAVAQSELNDFLGGTGVFPLNPPVQEGTFGLTSVRITRLAALRIRAGADLLAGGGQTTGRLYGDLRRSLGSGFGAVVRVKAGAATSPTAPQMLFRLGGLHTVRGFEYGSVRAPGFWAVQVDLTPFDARVRPVIFIDAGQAGPVSQLFTQTALVGAGVGLSLFRGFFRFDLSRPITPDRGGKVRFDLVIQGVR